MITINCFIEPVCTYSGEGDKFSVLEYSGLIAYKKKYFAGEEKTEASLLTYFKILLREKLGLSSKEIDFKFVESPEQL
jgi:hypothetical protein